MAATDAAKRVAQHLDRQFGPIDPDVMAERIDELTGLPELIAACESMFDTKIGNKASLGMVRNALRIAREGRR